MCRWGVRHAVLKAAEGILAKEGSQFQERVGCRGRYLGTGRELRTRSDLMRQITAVIEANGLP